MRKTAILASLLVAAALPALAISTGFSQTASPGHAESLEAWRKIATVLRHPRCLNCHQLNAPLRGDSRRVHVPRVSRGSDNRGVSAMRCGNCHNDMGNNPTSGTPGAPHWQLAPTSMVWQGLSIGGLCRALKNPKLNGNRTPEALIEHMEMEPLLLWSWNPGSGREPIPIPHQEFVDLVKVWAAGGAACPR